MDIGTQSLTHFPSSHVRDGMQCKTIIKLIMVVQIFPNAVDYEVKKFVLLVKEEGDSKISYLLFGILRGGYQVDCFKVSKINFKAVDVNVQKLRWLDLRLEWGGD
jgi:hypothetical protein